MPKKTKLEIKQKGSARGRVKVEKKASEASECDFFESGPICGAQPINNMAGVIVAIIVIAGIIIGGGVYLWQRIGVSDDISAKCGAGAEFSQENATLKNQVVSLQNEIQSKNDASVEGTRQINLYYYNKIKDLGKSKNPACSPKSVITVIRDLPQSNTPIEDALNLLLAGNITDEERAAGFETEFPGPGLKLLSAVLNNGILTLTFDDPDYFTSGGSCRVGLMWAQIEKTALQFPGVNEVRYLPDSLFQP